MSNEIAKRDEQPMAQLLELAINKEVSADTLERLVALNERVMEKAAATEFFEAVNAFQSVCPSIRKNAKAHHNTTYASLDFIAIQIRPFLKRHGLTYGWDSELVAPNAETGAGAIIKTTCTLRHISGHSETASFACPEDNSGSKSGAQATASALTYGKRQSLVQVLGLTTTDYDDDGAPPEERTVEKISESQAADLRSLMDEAKADEARFLKFFKVGSVDDLPKSELQKAIDMLIRAGERNA